jgi:tetratricopeptide (TPR) repeat protein
MKPFFRSSSILILLVCVPLSACFLFTKQRTTLEQADYFKERGDYKQAIMLYSEHLRDRLVNPLRPKNENPYFYLLLIGDVYLEDSNPIMAQQKYELAWQHNVSRELIADRFLTLATWYEKQGAYNKAIKILEQYRELDTLLYNAFLDKINKKITALEESPRPK